MADKLRTMLSLLGVCIGIFAIVAVFTLVDSLHATISEGFENYGADILFVESQPLEPDLNEDGVFRWWEYASRPEASFNEFSFLREMLGADARVAFVVRCDAGVVGVDGWWQMVVQDDIRAGRGFTAAELSGGAAVAILGSKAAAELFKNVEDPVGRSVKVGGRNFRVVGVFAERGANMVSTVQVDDVLLVPARSVGGGGRTSIAVSGSSAEELRLAMRQVRRLRPGDSDNFAINTLSFIVSELSEIFGMVSTLGWIVGIFSLLVGGFGIANIMFVGVEERTRQIGIQKALGARRRVIVREFLREAVLLSLGGGVCGVLLVWIGVLLIPASAITVRLSFSNAFLGLSVSVILGLLSGVAPAWHAARLSPLEAINH